MNKLGVIPEGSSAKRKDEKMSRDHIEGQASPFTEEAPERTETLLDVIGGPRGPFFGDLHEKYGLAEREAQAERQIDEWRKKFRL